jgi:hypothetical protein
MEDNGAPNLSTTPWYESNLLWGPFALSVGIILAVVAATKHDLRWLLWFAWPCFAISIWWLSRRTREVLVVTILGTVIAGLGLLWLNNWLRPESVKVAVNALPPQALTPKSDPAPTSRTSPAPPTTGTKPPKEQPETTKPVVKHQSLNPPTKTDPPSPSQPQSAPGPTAASAPQTISPTGPNTINNCPNGICISGGIVDHPTVNNLARPELQLTVSMPVSIDPKMFGTASAKFVQAITINVNVDYSPVSLAITCDAPVTDIRVLGSYTELKTRIAGSVYLYYRTPSISPEAPQTIYLLSPIPITACGVRRSHWI